MEFVHWSSWTWDQNQLKVHLLPFSEHLTALLQTSCVWAVGTSGIYSLTPYDLCWVWDTRCVTSHVTALCHRKQTSAVREQQTQTAHGTDGRKGQRSPAKVICGRPWVALRGYSHHFWTETGVMISQSRHAILRSHNDNRAHRLEAQRKLKWTLSWVHFSSWETNRTILSPRTVSLSPGWISLNKKKQQNRDGSRF